MSRPKTKKRPRVGAVAIDAIDAQRRKLFQASAIAAMCRLACASKFEGFDLDQMADALVVVYALIDEVAAALDEPVEQIGVGGVS